MNNKWPEEKMEQLRALAAAGDYASVIAEKLGTTQASIITMTGRYYIPCNKYTPAEQEVMKARRRATELKKNEWRKLKRRGERTAERTKKAAIIVDPTTNKTSAAYRNKLPPARDMSKNELRAMLTQAVRNTAEMVA